MEQISMFSSTVSYPETYEDVERLFRDHIFEGEKDDDVFTSNDTSTGRSYYFYGEKVFTFRPRSKKPSRMKIEHAASEWNEAVTPDNLPDILIRLKALKHTIFRNLTVEPFACCDEYKACSKAGACLHQDDRFFNRCYYRENLEAGRNFFREDGV